MPSIESLIEGSQKITDIFGCWPTFHDAEVIELHIWRGDVDPDRESYIFPVLTVKLHVWEWTTQPASSYQLIRRKHTLATLRFHHLNDDFRVECIDHDNPILELAITPMKRTDGPSPYFSVRFTPFTYPSGGSYGFGASFGCYRIEVVDAISCDEHGNLLLTSHSP